MLDMLVENHNLHLNISLRWMFVLWPFLCFVGRSQDKYTKQTASNCQALWVSKTPSVSAAYKPCLSVLQLPDCITTNTTSRSLSLTDEGITLNQSQRLHMKAFFPPPFWCAKCVICSAPVYVCNISSWKLSGLTPVQHTPSCVTGCHKYVHMPNRFVLYVKLRFVSWWHGDQSQSWWCFCVRDHIFQATSSTTRLKQQIGQSFAK